MLATPVEIDGAFNARAFGTPVPWLVRSSALDEASAPTWSTLREMGVTTIVDLRTDGEGAPSERVEGLDVARVPIYADMPPRLGRLDEVYATLLATRGEALARAVTAIAESDGAALVHCAVGKDRTGLVVALALLAADLPREEVIADYAISGEAVAARRTATVAAMLDAAPLDDAARADAEALHLASPPEAMAAALDRLEAGGGAAEYLLAHGMPRAALDRLRERVRA